MKKKQKTQYQPVTLTLDRDQSIIVTASRQPVRRSLVNGNHLNHACILTLAASSLLFLRLHIAIFVMAMFNLSVFYWFRTLLSANSEPSRKYIIQQTS